VASVKKKTVFFFITVALGTGLLFVCSNQSAANRNGAQKSESDPRQPQTVMESETDSMYGKEPNFFKENGYSIGGGEFLYRAVGAVLFVVVLGIAAIYVSKKLLPKISSIPGKEVRIVETIHLGPRKTVHLLEVGNQRFLIGSTNENITKLADINGNQTKPSTQQTDDAQEYL
jgi:flagellar biosynthetic protein FliO